MVGKAGHGKDLAPAIKRFESVALSTPLSGKSFALNLSTRGYQVLFWRDEVNHCPGCGHSQWHVGRITAECGYCHTALPLAEAAHAGLNSGGSKAVALHVTRGEGSAGKDSEKRQSERTSAVGRVIALHIDGSPCAFALQNISDGGAMGAALPGLEEACELVIELEDGALIPAELKWSNGEFAGLAFISSRKLARQ